MNLLRYLTVVVGGIILTFMTAHAKQPHGTKMQVSSQSWPLPTPGPKAVKGKKILYVAMDLNNGGILGVAEGLEEAAKEINWELIVSDAGGKDEKVRAIIKNAYNQNLDGIIVGGFNAVAFNEELQAFPDKNIKIVGWHAGGNPGPIEGTPVLTNITTDPRQVAKYAADEAIKSTAKKSGVIIFTDSHFEIALKKSGFMENEVRNCSHCELLQVIDLSISEKKTTAQKKIKHLLDQYGTRWTHSLGINDRYFDFAAPAFSMHKESFPLQIVNISAGDGSYSAYLRIKYGGLQYATIPEPLLFHGWQLIDELNRLFNDELPSNYIAPIMVITEENILREINKHNLFDPLNNYRKAYRNIWEADN